MTPARSSVGRRRALLVGATGLTGSRLLALLLASHDYGEVHVLARRPLATVHPKLRAQRVDFDALPGDDGFPAVDDVYCCLGTTIKAAGSRAAFRRVDLEYVVRIAARAHERGAQRLAVVSALGANPRSPVFYNRVKGEMERTVAALGYASIVVVRPSLLSGERAARRPGEGLALAFARLCAPLIPSKYRAVPAEAVARAMLASLLAGASGMRVIESDGLQRFAQRRSLKEQR